MRALRRFTIAIAAAALAGVAPLAVQAAAPNVVVPLDQSIRLEVGGSAASVLVGSPAIADVTVVDSHTLYISGRGYGSTDIVVLNEAGLPLYRGLVVVTSADVGRVSVYRGGARTDHACAPDCQVSTRSPAAGAAAAPALNR